MYLRYARRVTDMGSPPVYVRPASLDSKGEKLKLPCPRLFPCPAVCPFLSWPDLAWPGLLAFASRPPVVDFPSDAQRELGHDPNPNDMHVHDGGGGGGGDTWTRHVSGVASEDLAGSARQARHAAQRGHRRGAATDPDTAGEPSAFAFQLDDGRLPPGGGGGGGAPSLLTSTLDWMSGDGVDDPEGVHKRSLNGTSKGVSPAAGMSAGATSPREMGGDLIHRDSPVAMQQQLPQVCVNEWKLFSRRAPENARSDRSYATRSCVEHDPRTLVVSLVVHVCDVSRLG